VRRCAPLCAAVRCCALLCAAVRCCALLCAAVRCCALLCAAVRCCVRVLGIRRHAHPLSTPPWLAAKVCPMQGKFNTQATKQVPCRHGPSGSWSPAPQDGLERGQGVELIHRGVLLQVVHQHAAGLNPSNFRRAFRMRRVGSHTGRSGKFCERTRTDKCAMHAWNGGESKAHPRSSRGSTIAAGVIMSYAPQPRLPRAATATAVSLAATTSTTKVRLRDFATNMT